MKSLEAALGESRGVGPGFHFLRHALAIVIVTHHCRVAVFGFHADPKHGTLLKTAAGAAHLRLGDLAVELLRPGLFALVGMFFALSGFLVAGSAFRSKSIKTFFVNRVLRILPALSVEVTLSAVLLGALVTTLPLDHYFRDAQFFRYFGNIVGEVTFQLPGVFLGNPWPETVNTNLWTLPPELWCYLLMLVIMVSGFLSRPRWVTALTLTATAAVLALALVDIDRFTVRDGTTHFTPWYLVLMFLFGVVFFMNARRIPLHPALFVLSGLAYYALTLTERWGALGGIPLTYCTVYLGMVSFRWFDRILKMDLSYGIYLYGFPITQGVVFFLAPHLARMSPLARYAVILPLVYVLTAGFSALSWTFIEKPVLGLRKHFMREPPPGKAAPAAPLSQPSAAAS